MIKRVFAPSTMLRIAALSLIATVALAAPAGAHSVLIGSDPEADTAVASLPDRVSLQFNEPLQESFAAVTLTDSEGNRWSGEDVEVRGDTVSVGVAGAGPAGTYTIAYRVISADSHPVSGTVEFVVTEAGDGTSLPPEPGTTPDAGSEMAEPAAADDDSPLPVWPFIIGAVVVLAGGVAVILRSSRSDR
ncbi:copper resistance protein CopC [Hoyosella sp. YIM 151337]|uniref:copper resistance CopC family protein n=1 Tax=Hoyosella sp. YIM 151337 TaxID=2992742 RepID=UPI002236B386|nr:copper resistance CopC family protein [Hoyosella sp. YIM 151337]MCW4354747.1 copper resistance protein CopC [Hoyosella sp. YIM 151337]